MENPKLLEDYFNVFMKRLDPNNLALVQKAFSYVPDIYYVYPAASGNHHNSLQACNHGLLYHVYEGLIALTQFMRARSDILLKIQSHENYQGTSPESDLLAAYLMHDICKYRLNPTGTYPEHDEAAYSFAKKLGFKDLVCNIIRFTHGQWSTAITKGIDDFRGSWYEDIVWLSHYADMAASSKDMMKFIDRLEQFDKKVFAENRSKKKDDTTIDAEWWVLVEG